MDSTLQRLDNFALEQLAPVLQRKGTEAQLEELALSDNDALIGKEMDKKTKFFQVVGWWGSGRVDFWLAINLSIASIGVDIIRSLQSESSGR